MIKREEKELEMEIMIMQEQKLAMEIMIMARSQRWESR